LILSDRPFPDLKGRYSTDGQSGPSTGFPGDGRSKHEKEGCRLVRGNPPAWDGGWTGGLLLAGFGRRRSLLLFHPLLDVLAELLPFLVVQLAVMVGIEAVNEGRALQVSAGAAWPPESARASRCTGGAWFGKGARATWALRPLRTCKSGLAGRPARGTVCAGFRTGAALLESGFLGPATALNASSFRQACAALVPFGPVDHAIVIGIELIEHGAPGFARRGFILRGAEREGPQAEEDTGDHERGFHHGSFWMGFPAGRPRGREVPGDGCSQGVAGPRPGAAVCRTCWCSGELDGDQVSGRTNEAHSNLHALTIRVRTLSRHEGTPIF